MAKIKVHHRFYALLLMVLIIFVANAQIRTNEPIFGLTASINYGFPQVDATFTDQLGITQPYNSLYGSGFGASIGGVALVSFNQKLGLRTGLGAEWRNYRYASTGSFGVIDNPKEYYHNFYLLNVPAVFQFKPTKGFAIELGSEFNMAFAQNLEESSNALVEPDIFKPEVVANIGIQFLLAANSYIGVNARWGLAPLGTYEGTFGFANQYTTNDMKFLHRGLSVSYYYIFK